MSELGRMTAADVVETSDDERMFVEVVAQIADAEIEPRARSIEQSDRIPRALISLLLDQELAGIAAPVELGGSGGRPLLAVLVVERIAEASAAVGLALGLRQAGLMAMTAHGGGDGRIDAFAPPVLVDAERSASCLDGTLTGTASACLPEDGADLVLIVGDADDGERAVLIATEPAEAGRKRLKRTGLRGMEWVRLDLGGCGTFIDLGVGAVDVGRIERALAIGACAIGVGRRAVRVTAAYLEERRQFGRPLSRFGALRRLLAEAADGVAAAAALLHLAASSGSATSAAQAARRACEAAVTAADTALQLHGGYGYIDEYLPERLLRDAVTLRAILGPGAAARSARGLLVDAASN